MLTDAKRREFPMRTHAQDEEEILSANELNTDPEDELINSPPGRTEQSRDRQEEMSRKRRKLQEIAVTEERERRPFPPNSDCLTLGLEQR